MINYLFLSIFFSVTLEAHYAETLDFWQVYVNKEKIKEFRTAGKQNKVILTSSSVKAADSLRIQYFTAAGCDRCSYVLRIATENKISLFEVPSNTKTISLSLKELLKLQIANNAQPLDVCLIENRGFQKKKETTLFTVKIE